LYLKEKGGKVLLSDFNKSLSNDKILHLTSSLKPLCIEKLRVREMTLDLDSNLSVVEAYSKQGYFIEPKENYFDEYGSMGEKDSTGRMGYIIIDETKDGKPILLDNRNVSNGKEKPNYLSVFRFAVTMRPKQYK